MYSFWIYRKIKVYFRLLKNYKTNYRRSVIAFITVTISTYFFGIILFRLFYIGWELTFKDGVIDFALLLGIVYANIDKYISTIRGYSKDINF